VSLDVFPLCLESPEGQVKQAMQYFRVENPVNMSPSKQGKRKKGQRDFAVVLAGFYRALQD